MKKRERRFQFNLNLSNRLYYTLILIGILIVGGWIVWALTPGVAPNPGHTLTEVAPPAGCSNNQVLQWNATSGSWVCASDMTDTDTKCDISGTCSQVCIGSDCKTSWPSGGTKIGYAQAIINARFFVPLIMVVLGEGILPLQYLVRVFACNFLNLFMLEVLMMYR